MSTACTRSSEVLSQSTDGIRPSKAISLYEYDLEYDDSNRDSNMYGSHYLDECSGSCIVEMAEYGNEHHSPYD